MELLGTIAASSQLIEALTKGLHRVHKVCQEIKHLDQTLKDFDADLDHMRMALDVVQSTILTASKPEVQLPDWLKLQYLTSSLKNAERMLLSLEKIFHDIKERTQHYDGHFADRLRAYITWKSKDSTINHLRARMTTFVTMMHTPVVILNMQTTTSKVNSNAANHKAHALRDHIRSLKGSIDELRRHTSEAQQDQGGLNAAGLNDQSTKDTVNDSYELASIAGNILKGATTVAASTISRIGVGTTRGTPATSHKRRSGVKGSQSSVYGPALAFEASISLMGVPLSTEERDKISHWRDNVGTYLSGLPVSPRPKSKDMSNPGPTVDGPSSDKWRLDTKSGGPVPWHQLPGPLVDNHEPDPIAKAVMKLISPDFEEIRFGVAKILRSKIREKNLGQIKAIRRQLLETGSKEIHRISSIEDARAFLDAIFQSYRMKSNPFVLSPSLMEARFLTGKFFYQRGNLVMAAPLLIIFASSERGRTLSSGADEGSSHLCRPETQRSLLCGKLLCQLDPFSFLGPRSCVCSECRGKSAWPYLPMLFAFLALHKYSHGAMGLPKNFSLYAERAVSECFAVMDHMAEDTWGTLAVAFAVLKLMQDRDASFKVKNVPIGVDMQWKGSLSYFESQQISMLDLSETDHEKSAHMGIELIKRYRRIDYAQAMDDRKAEPTLYECIRKMLIGNGGKLWAQAPCADSCKHSRFPVLEFLVTCTPRLQWGVFGAAEEIKCLLDMAKSEDPSFSWNLGELSHLIRTAIIAGNPMAVAILMRSPLQSDKPVEWPLLFRCSMQDLGTVFRQFDKVEVNTARWKAVQTAINCLPILSIPETIALMTECDTHPSVMHFLYKRLLTLLHRIRFLLVILRLREMIHHVRLLTLFQNETRRGALVRSQRTSVVPLRGRSGVVVRRKRKVVKARTL